MPAGSVTLTIPNWRPEAIEALIKLAVNGLPSPHSRRAYDTALRQFFAWLNTQPGVRFDKATLQMYRLKLDNDKLSAASINLKMAAIRRLAVEAMDSGLLAPEVGAGILRVKGMKRLGVRRGRWLGRDDAERLRTVPDGQAVRPGWAPMAALKGIRDRALLAVFLGCGLRRQEIVDLTLEHIAMREGRWCVVDLLGKGGRVRTVVMPDWVKGTVDEWTAAADITSGLVFRSVHRKQRLTGKPLAPQAVYKSVTACAARLGLKVACHDLRRSHARLAFKGGINLSQLQIALGHSSIRTTEIYVMADQDLQDAPCDHLGIGTPSVRRASVETIVPVPSELRDKPATADAGARQSVPTAPLPTDTEKAYARDWRDFESYCAANGLTALPAIPETVARFLAARSYLKPGTLHARLIAISNAHHKAGYKSSPASEKHALIAEALANIRRARGAANG